jgi:membrane-associated phospholipid phosphatase
MMQDFWTALLTKDKALFSTINGEWTCNLFDQVMPWVRDSKNWIPLYIVILIFLFYKWGVSTWRWMVLVVVNITLTDQISSSFFKPFFHRPRPCADPAIMANARLLLDHCSGGFSFTSSHAANHFGIALFIVMTLAPVFKNYRFVFLLWAAVISYAQIYVGVHYPLDVLCGAFIGLTIGYFNGKLYHQWQASISAKRLV